MHSVGIEANFFFAQDGANSKMFRLVNGNAIIAIAAMPIWMHAIRAMASVTVITVVNANRASMIMEPMMATASEKRGECVLSLTAANLSGIRRSNDMAKSILETATNSTASNTSIHTLYPMPMTAETNALLAARPAMKFTVGGTGNGYTDG